MILGSALLALVVAAPPRAFPYDHEQVTLRNGLTLVMVPRRGTGLLAYDTLVRAGSRNEVEPGRSGYAHFFEHMMFRGTPATPPDVYAEVMRRHGANGNAYTEEDFTLFTVTGRAEGLADFARVEADRFQSLTYTREAFETEAAAVLGEYGIQHADPSAALWDALLSTAYTRHPYRHPVIGLEADIRAMPRGYEYSRTFFRNYYTPDNTAVIIVGDFEPTAARALVEREYRAWKGRSVLPRTEREPPQTEEQRRVLAWPEPAQPRTLWAWHVPAASPATVRETATGQVTGELLFGPTGPLYTELVLRQQWCESLHGGHRARRDPGLFVVGFTLRDAARAADVEAAIEAELRRVAEEGVAPEALQAARSHARYALLARLEKDDVIAEAVAEAMQLTGRLQWMDALEEARAGVTVEDVRAFVARWLIRQNRSVVSLSSAREGEAP